MKNFIQSYFRLNEHGTTIRKELVAGLTTFAAMSYILAVNPAILADAGMDQAALVTVTALAAAIGTILLALLTNYPIAMAPGMGLNAFFTYTICIGMGIPWEAALAMVFYNGVLFLMLSLTRLRQRIIDAIPHALKIAITSGIGLFIAFIGLKNGEIIIADGATLVGLGNLSEPVPALVLFGIILTGILVARNITGAILISIIVLSVLGLFFPDPSGNGAITQTPSGVLSLPESIAPTFLALDFMYPITHFASVWPIILALLFVDLFDTVGTLIGVSSRAGLLDENGQLPKAGPALTADASATVIGSLLGSSTTTCYIESSAGVEEGGRTGLTALTVAGCFLLALFFTPLILSVPASATAPALVIVGIFMMQGLTKLDLSDFTVAAPAAVTLLMMPLAFSISEGIAFGLIVYAFLKAGTGKFREVSPIVWVLTVLFLMYYFWIG